MANKKISHGEPLAKNFQKKAMIEALKKTLGIVSTAADKVGITRQTHYNWLKDDKDYREAVEETLEVRLDFIESALFKKIHEGETPAIIFAAKTLGRKRGYYDKVEVESHNTNLNIGVPIEDAKKLLENMTDEELALLEKINSKLEEDK